MSPLPNFNSERTLPPGEHEILYTEFQTSFLVYGTGRSQTWDTEWRKYLVQNLGILIRQLWQVGITDIFIGGSFVEEKDHPNDIDGCFACDINQWQTGTLQSQLNQLDPDHVWTWDASTRMKHPDASSKKLPMWHRYRVELYPHHLDSGIYNLKGKRMNFLEAFQTTRGGRKHRGVLKIKSGGAYDPQ